MIDEATRNYIDSLNLLNFKENDLTLFRKRALLDNIPIITTDVENLLKIIIPSSNIKSILEIGCAVGYSSIFFSEIMGEKGKVVTLERNEVMLNKAKENIALFNKEDKITPVLCDAGEFLKEHNEKYDMIFLDGNKGHYIHMLDDCLCLLKDGGLLICDNVLFKGMVDKSSPLIRRKITIVKRLRKFLEAISSNPLLDTTVMPIGDGLSISLKKTIS